MKQEKKLYDVVIGSVDPDGIESFRWRSEKVVAESATKAMFRVRLKKSKYFTEFYAEVNLISGIDKP